MLRHFWRIVEQKGQTPMRGLVRIPLEGGGSLLFDAPAVDGADGPVKATKLGDAIRDLPHSLETTLVPVRQAAQVMLDQLRKAGPDEVELEFGVDLASQAGAVIAKSEAGFHLKVRVTWHGGKEAPPEEPAPSAS